VSWPIPSGKQPSRRTQANGVTTGNADPDRRPQRWYPPPPSTLRRRTPNAESPSCIPSPINHALRVPRWCFRSWSGACPSAAGPASWAPAPTVRAGNRSELAQPPWRCPCGMGRHPRMGQPGLRLQCRRLHWHGGASSSHNRCSRCRSSGAARSRLRESGRVEPLRLELSVRSEPAGSATGSALGGPNRV
jgi:hypothetical protein